jgi:putative ABC transport system permease protein
MAIKSILSNKARSFLTMLGVIIGVSSVIAAVAFAQGSTKSITDSIEGLGTNMIQVSITGRGSNRNLEYEELEEYIYENNDLMAGFSPSITSSVTVKSVNDNKDIDLLGVGADYQYIKSRYVQSGRFILSIDEKYMQRVAVIGTALSNTLFPSSDPVGENIKINGEQFEVVDLLQEIDQSDDDSDDDVVMMPYNVAQRLTGSTVISSYLIQSETADTVDTAMSGLEEFLSTVYSEDDTSSYRVYNQTQMLSTLSDVTNIMMIVLGGIAAISLVVGGIGIMNIMLVSVTERTREIGIRKAVGAKRFNIMIQFLIEAIMVTSMGGIMGILAGIALIKWVVGNFTTPVYSLTWMIISFGISLIVGVIFGSFPAYKAARLNPIEALRFE